MTAQRVRDFIPEDAPVYVISVAAELAGLHPQTLRQYDRMGIVSPRRASGRNRLYSMRDIARLREVQQLADLLRAKLAELTEGQNSTALVVWRPQRRR